MSIPTETPTTELQKLQARLDATKGLLQFHVTLGDNPGTAEDVAREINSAFAQFESGEAEVFTIRHDPATGKTVYEGKRPDWFGGNDGAQ